MATNNEPDDHRPYLFIPYWTTPLFPGDRADTGEQRPLPPAIISWACPGIRATAYSPGSDLTVEVDIGNWGGGNSLSLVSVTVWWTDPATGFTGFAAMTSNEKSEHLIGARLVKLPPRGGQATSEAMTKTIPPTAPPHICLLARVYHEFDQPGAVPDPIGDRHWAQLNLQAVTALPETPLEVTFLAGNPFADEATFVLGVQPIARENLVRLASTIQAEPVFIPEARFILDHAEVTLNAGAQRPIHLRADLSTTLATGQFTSFEILQFRDDRRPVGSLGIVVQPPSHD